MNWWSIVVTSSVVAAAVSGLFNLASRLLENRLSRKRERKQQLWRQKQEDIRDLEYNAGYLTEYLAGYQSVDADSKNLWEALEEIRDLKYRLRKYPRILQAIRDFRNTAGFRLHEGKEYSSVEQKEESVEELEDRYENLVQACKDELRKDEV
ncbi:hypothetical protein [Salinibacter sp.]|uniref:hypothetical protein n=1 Tax=Salinibacter sp. TaxID=2065818 RepID=UPI0021E72725|nr:hypothetical protein [Salinibacter sp.]